MNRTPVSLRPTPPTQKRLPRNLFALAALLLFSAPVLSAQDPRYAILESLLGKETLPRLLNSEDVGASPTDPRPLDSPDGDFDGDGRRDIAIAGTRALPGDHKPYFVLVAAGQDGRPAYRRLHYEEHDRPPLLHRPGSTGPADPNDQAFSLSFCAPCDKGFDYYWNQDEQRFDRRPWRAKIQRGTRPAPAPQEIPEAVVDKALRVVGALDDVKRFVESVSKAGNRLVTRVNAVDGAPVEKSVRVEIWEKVGEGERLYDRLVVDLERERISGREKAPTTTEPNTTQ